MHMSILSEFGEHQVINTDLSPENDNWVVFSSYDLAAVNDKTNELNGEDNNDD